MAIEETLRNILFEKFNVKDFSITESIESDLGLDSLDQVELIMSIEDTYDLEIPDDDVMQLKNMKDWKATVGNKRS